MCTLTTKFESILPFNCDRNLFAPFDVQPKLDTVICIWQHLSDSCGSKFKMFFWNPVSAAPVKVPM
jgi:hypothetical protein